MIRCSRVESLFSACWEDELSVAEREALEAHFGACPACRGSYDGFVRGMEAVQALPRLEAEPGFAETVLARVRAAERAPAVRRALRRSAPAWIGGWEWGWRPALAAATLAVVVGVGAYSIRNSGQVPSGSQLARSTPGTAPVAGAPGLKGLAARPAEPAAESARRIAAVPPTAQPGSAAAVARGLAATPRRDAAGATRLRANALAAGPSGAPAARLGDEAAVVPDSLFDHAYDLEFALDPVHLRRVPGEQKLRPARPVPAAEDGRKASITF
jgi:anti-sigma factor RsiW